MQIVESSALGVRAARYSFASATSPWTITLFPMIHFGEPEFYEAVYADAFTHDVVLVEGVRSPVTKRLTRAYRWIGPKIGLIVQPPYPSPESVPARIVRADLDEGEFRKEWQQVPLWLRMLVSLVAPIAGLRLRWFESRDDIAKRAELEDRLSSDEILSWDPQLAALKRGIVDARDRRLLQHLEQELSGPAAHGSRLAIVYGAEHMRAVIRELKRQEFSIASAGWRTVFHL